MSTARDEAADEISEETRLMAAQVRARAAQMPTPADIAGLGADAFGGRRDMSPAEIRHLFEQVVAQSQQVAFLLGRLAGLEGGAGGERE